MDTDQESPSFTFEEPPPRLRGADAELWAEAVVFGIANPGRSFRIERTFDKPQNGRGGLRVQNRKQADGTYHVWAMMPEDDAS